MSGENDEADSLEAAFSLVANDIRFEILKGLWEAKRDDALPVSFSSLLECVDVRDSGQFNYHLGKLVPRFVRDVGDGYELTYAGEKVIGAAASGVYTDTDVTVDAIEVGDCSRCGGTMTARYEGGRLEVECVDCDVVITDGLRAPPVLAANHDPEDLPQVFSRLLLTRTQSVTRGFCQLCGGPVEPSLDETYDDLHVRQTCQECGSDIGMSIAALVMDHPAVVSFLYEDDIDLRDTHIWELDWLFEADATVVNEDPLDIEISIEREGDRLELRLDDELAVVESSRD